MFKDRYSVKTHLRQLFMQKYERYLPTAFDSSHSILEKVNGIIESHNRVIDMVNNHVEFTSDQLERAFGIIDENLEGELKSFRDDLQKQTEMYEDIRDKIHSDLLPDSVRRVLEEWELDGTIEEMLGEEVLTEFRKRLEDAENRIESNELMAEVSVKDFSYLVDETSENPDWTEAFNEAIKVSNNVIIPEGEYNLSSRITLTEANSNMSFTGRGEATKIRVPDGSDVFNLAGSIGEIKRVSREYVRGSKEIYLDDTSGLEPGDDVLLQSQKNCLNFSDTGVEWLLGAGTGSDPQRVPFGEFLVVDTVYSDRVVFTSTPIYPFYNSHSGDEQRAVFDFSRVRKVNFVKNVTLKDFVVDEVRTGFAMRTRYAKNCVADNVKFVDNVNTSASRGVCNIVASLSCEVRNSYFESPLGVDFDDSDYWYQNPFKIVSSQNCGFLNCRGENTSQMVDLSFFGEYLPNTGCYIKDCTSIGASRSAFTTHGGNYLTTFTGNYSEGSHQGFSHRGRGAIIGFNTIIGNSYNQDSYLRSGISLYQGGACDNIVIGNQIRGFANGISYSDGGDHATGGRARNLNTLITQNTISNCRRLIRLYRYHTGAIPDEEMNVVIENNMFKMDNNTDSSSVHAIWVNERNQGIIIRNNIIKGIRGEMVGFTGDRKNNFYGVMILPNADKIQVYDNIFQDIDIAIEHNGTSNPYTSGVYPDGVEFMERDNTYTRVRLNNRYRGNIINLSHKSFTASPSQGSGNVFSTTGQTDMFYYGPDGYEVRNMDDRSELIPGRGLWQLVWNFRVRGVTGRDGGATIRLTKNGETIYQMNISDNAPQTMSIMLSTSNTDVFKLQGSADTGISAQVDGGVGRSYFSLSKIGD